MSIIQRLLKSLRPDREIADELAFHIDERTRELIGRGMSPADARTAALRAFGNPGALTEQTRDADVLAWLDTGRRDLTIAIRSLAQRKGLVVTSICSLAIGIGATTALFSLADPIFLRALPIPHPEEVIVVVETQRGERSGSNALRMADWAAQVPSFASVGGEYSESAILTGEGSPERLRALRSFGQLLAVFQEQPALGRAFTTDEERGMGSPVALLSSQTWRKRYHADPATLGRVLRINNVPTTIIGILPETAGSFEKVDLIAPAPAQVQQASRQAAFLQVLARMKPGITLAQVQPQLKAASRRLARQYPATDGNRSAYASGLREETGLDARRPVLLLFGTSVLVLLIACVNVASLLLARAGERRREVAIRIALGAGRGSLLRHFLAESLLLSAAGGIAGLALGKAGLAVLLRFLPATVELPGPARFDWRVALFALCATMASSLVFALVPGCSAAFGKTTASLSGGTRTTSGSSKSWARMFLVSAQVALSVILLVALGLTAKSLYYVRTAPLGFQPASVMTMQIDFPWDTPPNRLEGFSTKVLDQLRSAPGISAAGMVDRLPLGGGTQSGPVAVRGTKLSPDLQDRPVDFRTFKGDYLRAAGIHLQAGREPREHTAGLGEVMVNETFARRYFPLQEAVGQFVSTNPKPLKGGELKYRQIVGIVADVRVSPTQTEQPAELFLLSRDSYWPHQNYIIRGTGQPATLARSAREAARTADPNQLIDKVAPMQDQLLEASSDQQTRLWLLTAFGLAALVLAAIGLYGVLASDVVQRTNEIGVRMALGAQPARILSTIVARGLWLAASGIAAGLAIALVLGRVIASLLYGVQPGDPLVLTAVICLLACVAAGASYLPARRAARVDPVVALRHN